MGKSKGKGECEVSIWLGPGQGVFPPSTGVAAGSLVLVWLESNQNQKSVSIVVELRGGRARPHRFLRCPEVENRNQIESVQ